MEYQRDFLETTSREMDRYWSWYANLHVNLHDAAIIWIPNNQIAQTDKVNWKKEGF